MQPNLIQLNVGPQKSRFTAYMLWAREVRPDIIDKNPDMGKLGLAC